MDENGSKKYIQDIEKCQELMKEMYCSGPLTERLQVGKFKLGKKYKLILWDILSYDFKEKNPTKLKNNILENISDGSIVVFHNNKKSYEILKKTLKI